MDKQLSIETKQFYAELNSGIGGSSVPTIIGDPAAVGGAVHCFQLSSPACCRKPNLLNQARPAAGSQT